MSTSPLHVEPPSRFTTNLSPDSPPTPYTPQSAVFLHKDSDSASMSSARAPRPPAASSNTPQNVPDGQTNGAENLQHATRSPSLLQEGEGEDRGLELELPTMNVGLPDTLPPSPPLTEIEGRDEDPNPSRLQQGSSKQNGANQLEEDITDWHRSVDGSYHESDLGYSTGNEVSPIDVRGATRPEGMHQDRMSVASRQEPQHPLRFDVQPPSPPLWEVIQPPEHNNVPGRRKLIPAATTGDRVQKAATTRPLIPFSSYYFGPPAVDAAYGTEPIGQLGLHHPREIIRIERDYSGGELVQFAPIYPLELEGRITPTQFLETVNTINEILISAHSLRHSMFDSALAFFSLQLSRFMTDSHYDKEMARLRRQIEEINRTLYNPVGLNILWPRRVAFMFLEIEYY